MSRLGRGFDVGAGVAGGALATMAIDGAGVVAGAAGVAAAGVAVGGDVGGGALAVAPEHAAINAAIAT
jgi:hypothetical protein